MIGAHARYKAIDTANKRNARMEAIESAAQRNANATSLADKRASFLDLQRAAFPGARVGKPSVRVSRAGQLAVRRGR